MDGSKKAVKRLKLLIELKIIDESDLELFLNGCGWEVLAESYGMEKKFTNELKRHDNPGRWLLKYLGAARPRLTVKNFCKTAEALHLDDIAKHLEKHIWTSSPETFFFCKFKNLADIDLTTEDDLILLLNKDIIGVRDYRLIAEHYGMPKEKIIELSRARCPGEELLGYIKTKVPTLSTKDFAKAVGGPTFNRKDIAERLNPQGLNPITCQFIKNGLDVNMCNKYGQTPLHLVAARGSVREVELFLQYGAKMNKTDKFLRTPLQIAKYHGHTKVVEVMSSYKDEGTPIADIASEAVMQKQKPESLKSMKKLHCMALKAAYRTGDATKIKKLIDHGVINQELDTTCIIRPRNSDNPKGATKIEEMLQELAEKENITQLHQAVLRGDIEEVLAIALDCVDEHVNSVANKGVTYLHLASARGDLEMVRALLLLGATVDAKAADKTTPLLRACLANRYHVAQALTREGADMCVTDSKGYTILHAAAQNGSAPLLYFILQQKNRPDVNAKDRESRTPLHRACQQGQSHVAQNLLKAGADPSLLDANGNLAIHLAAENGHSSTTKILLETSNHQHQPVNKSGMAPLHLAVLKDSVNTVKALLNGAANVNTECGTGDYPKAKPLHLASKTGSKKMVSLLLENGADHTLRDENGNTPLHSAVSNGSSKVVKYLLDHGAKITAENVLGMTPLDLAKDLGLEDIVRIIQEKISRLQCAGPQFEAVQGLAKEARDTSSVPGTMSRSGYIL